ncbi:unnamed protein product [Cercospora beticola]|nr:unnamed protein product [Cercospora beticola]
MPPPIEKPPPRRLDNLPIEMQLQILSNLPPRQLLLTCRLISRHFRDIIDLEENHGTLVGGSIAASLDRLNAFVKRYCEFPTKSEDGGPDAFVDAMFDFIRVRRLSKSNNFDGAFDGFLELWLQRSGAPFGRPSISDLADELFGMCEFPKPFLQTSHGTWFFEAYGNKVEIMCDRIQDFLQSYDCQSHPVEPKWPIMARRYFPKAGVGPDSIRRSHDMEALHRTFGVPVLPVLSPYYYCISSSMARTMCTLAMDEGSAFPELSKAILLEEISIY